MALGQGLHENQDDIRRRFNIAADKPPYPPELEVQRGIRELIQGAALNLNEQVQDSREKSLALTALEEALMWAGKAVFK